MLKINKLLLILFLLIINVGIIFPKMTLAAEDVKTYNSSAEMLYDDIKENQLGPLSQTGLPGAAEGEDYDLLAQIAKTIKVALGTLVIIFMSLIIYAGFKWLTSGGNEQTIGDAKKMISAALIGVVIIFFAYAITVFVFNLILNNRIS